MKYKITIKPDDKINTGDVLEANGRTTFNYKNYKDEDTVKEFPIPKITVGGGNILVHYYMVNGNGQPINESGVVVDNPSLAKQVKKRSLYCGNYMYAYTQVEGLKTTLVIFDVSGQPCADLV